MTTSTTMTSGDQRPLVIVDTNVLLAATDASRGSHVAATEFLRLDPRSVALTPQIVREYLVVATRPPEVNGLGLSPARAAANVEEFLGIATLLREGMASTSRLLTFMADGLSSGKQVHDANVVACALAHGVAAIVTDNVRHFARFAPLIDIEALAEASRP
ncbi:MAG TPA: PIN domain-containing protein [Phycicoccus sp.]|nr:PIN domain-containing protein [Phycicoccus sp.]HQH08255.1 PIN domain-containing protein [Phycicoccus sp.]HQK30346.1 PIN domain-containing protein [Phycicoccus sp.]